MRKSGKTIKEVAEDLGICHVNLSRWEKEYQRDAEYSFTWLEKLKPAEEAEVSSACKLDLAMAWPFSHKN